MILLFQYMRMEVLIVDKPMDNDKRLMDIVVRLNPAYQKLLLDCAKKFLLAQENAPDFRPSSD